MKKLLFIATVLLSMSSNAQFTQQFEASWAGTPPAPPSWSVINVGGTGVAWEQSPAGSTEYPAYGGTGHSALLRIDTEPATNPVQQDWLVTDLVQVPVGSVSLRFFSRLLLDGNQGSTYKVVFAPATADPTLPSSYTELQSWTELSLNPVQLEYTEKSVNIPPAIAGTMVRFAFVMTGNNADGWLVDNVMFASQCASPTNLTVNLSGTAATLGWTSDGATSWEIEVIPGGAAPTGQGAIVTSNSVVVGGTTGVPQIFVPGQEYKYYVRSLCPDGGMSVWAGPLYFSNNICPMPTNVVMTTSTPMSLAYSWTATTAASYDYWVTTTNAIPNASTIPSGNVATPTVTLVGLPVGENYKFYVRSNCGAGGVSPWAGLPVSPNVMNNILYGSVRYDSNGDGICGSGDTFLPNVQVQVSIDNGAQYSVYTNQNGEYKIYTLADGTYTVTAQVVSPFFNNIAPVVQQVTFDEVINNAEVNHCLGQPVAFSDLRVTFISLGVARPGFDSAYKVYVYNSGSTALEDAVVNLSFNNNRITYVSSGFTGVTATAGNLSIPVGDLQAFSSVNGNIIFHTMIPPTNIGGELLHFEAVLSDVPNDVAPDNNHAALNQIIVNSYDPNDIRVHEGTKIYEEQADDYLTYTIRFQNTGNGEAINVKLENTLDDLLDWDTFEPVASSHNNAVKREDSQLEFFFADINLPYESANEPGSHGFVTYRIKPKAEYGLGDFVYNTAEIYFDFNEAIVTNTASTEVVASTAGVHDNALAVARLYPNPVKDKLFVEATQGELQSITVYDINGRLCLSANAGVIDTNVLTAGIYFIKITTDAGSANYKVIKY
jgi:hypothetical protein